MQINQKKAPQKVHRIIRTPSVLIILWLLTTKTNWFAFSSFFFCKPYFSRVRGPAKQSSCQSPKSDLIILWVPINQRLTLGRCAALGGRAMKVEAMRHGADRCGSTWKSKFLNFGAKKVFPGWLREQSGVYYVFCASSSTLSTQVHQRFLRQFHLLLRLLPVRHAPRSPQGRATHHHCGFWGLLWGHRVPQLRCIFLAII